MATRRDRVVEGFPLSDEPARVGEYRLESLLGRGGMGAVYLAEHEPSGSRVALKLLAEGAGEDEQALKRFELELRALERLDHSGVTRALGPMGRADGRVFFPLEYVRGGSLRDLLDGEGALPLGRSVRLARSIFDALAAAHSVGVVHRDVKPPNVLLPDEGADAVKIGDFGLARLMDATRMTTPGTVLGTLSYMSPEQCEGTRSIDARADIYAAGVVLYEMLAGGPPFQADTPLTLLRAHMVQPPPPIERVRPDVPPELARFLADCLAKRPADRVQTAADAVERIDAFPAMPDSRVLAAPEPESALPSADRVTMTQTRRVTPSPSDPEAPTRLATPSERPPDRAPEPAPAPAPRRRHLGVGIAAVALLLVAGVVAVGLRRNWVPGAEPTSANAVVAGVLERLSTALRDGDFERFSGAFTDEYGRTHLAGPPAEPRFRAAVRRHGMGEFEAVAVAERLDGGRMQVVVRGALLPAALGVNVPRLRPSVQLELEETRGEMRIADVRAAKAGRGRETSGAFQAADRAMKRYVAQPESWIEIARRLEGPAARDKRRMLRAWAEKVRDGEVLPPTVRFDLAPDGFDRDAATWTVRADVAELAERMERPGAQLELVLRPTRKSNRGPVELTLDSARLVE